MNRYELKTTLRRSDPQVIRQFTIDGSATVEKLLQTVALLHGWDRNTALFLCSDAKQPPKEEILDTLFQEEEQDGWEIRLPRQETSKRERTILDVLAGEVWSFRLDILQRMPRQEQEPSAPAQLIRFRGVHPYDKARSMPQCNHVMMEETGILSRYYSWNSVDRGDLRVDPKKINRRLSLLEQDGEEFTVHMELGLPWKKIMESYTVEEIKDMLRFQDIGISYQGRKAFMVEQIVSYLDKPSFWHEILVQMSISEYQAFKKLCGEGQAWGSHRISDLPVLNSYLMTPRYYGGEFSLPRELLSYYGSWMEEEGDTQLLDVKFFYSAYKVSADLYCIFHKDILYRILQILFPERKDLERIFTEQYQRMLEERTDSHWALADDEVIYAVPLIDPKTASTLRLSRKNTELYYIPDREEALSILEHGLTFSEKTGEWLKNALDECIDHGYWYSFRDTDYMAEEIYEMFHLSYDTDMVIKNLREHFGTNFYKNKMDKLRNVLDQCRTEVRMVNEFGYTLRERKEQQEKAAVRNARGSSGPRVYPNDPCPCGSGKKYKHCHGKYKK